MLFIVDADFPENQESGYERTRKSLEYYKDKLKDVNEGIKIEYFITPDNKHDGMTETLIMNCLNCTKIVEHMKRGVQEVKEMEGSEIKNKTESGFLMVAATHNPLKGSVPAFLSGCL